MSAQATGAKVPRYGLVALRIGADLIIKGKDNIKRQFRALDKKKFNKVKAVVRCLHCREEYPDEAELRASHPDHAAMVRDAETHLFFWWSDEHQTKDSKDPSDVYGLLSEEE